MASPKHILNTHTNQLGSGYPISMPAFEGPLDLLLHLINRDELDISTVSLMTVTESYLATIRSLEELEPGGLADFLVIASRLLYIKSRTLLPRATPPDDDEEEDEDEEGGGGDPGGLACGGCDSLYVL